MPILYQESIEFDNEVRRHNFYKPDYYVKNWVYVELRLHNEEGLRSDYVLETQVSVNGVCNGTIVVLDSKYDAQAIREAITQFDGVAALHPNFSSTVEEAAYIPSDDSDTLQF